MKEVLVAGATGYRGRHVVAVLRHRGYRVRALARPGREVPDAHTVVHAEVTDPESLRGACDGVDAVFSALGITRQKDRGITFRDIELDANAALLRESLRAGVGTFGTIAVLDAERFAGVAMVDAKEQFVRKLLAESPRPRVVRSTGFFSDMGELLAAARHGVVPVIGDGRTRINPVDGADVAETAVNALEGDVIEVAVGGPEVLTWDEVADLARGAGGRKAHIVHVPSSLVHAALPVMRAASPKTATIADFMLRVASADLIGPATGTRRLADWYARGAGATA